MFSWRFIKAFPKIALVAGVLLLSTGMFLWWWMFRSPERLEEQRERKERKREEIAKTVIEVSQRLGRLVLIDNSLYDIDTGELYFKDWLQEGVPLGLYLEPDRKHFIAQYDKGLVRYGLDGARKEALLHRYKLPFDSKYKTAVFCKDKDIWKADLDWSQLKLINERKVTSIGQFNDRFFAENLVFGTDKTVVVRISGRMARIDMESGEVKPVSYPLADIVKRRSPDSRYLVGLEKGQFYCHEIDTDKTKTLKLDRGSIQDFQWLGNDRCIFIVGGTSVMLYNRVEHSLSDIATLPVHGDNIGGVSPDGRFVLTSSINGICVVKIEEKKAVRIVGGQGIGWISNDTLMFSRETLDSTLRGTWLQKSGSPERRIYEQPFIAGREGGAVLVMKDAGVVIFSTKEAVLRMNPDGTEIKPVMKLQSIAKRSVSIPSLIKIGDWKP